MILIPFLLMDQKLWAVQGELIVLCFSFNCRQSLQYYIPLCILLDCSLPFSSGSGYNMCIFGKEYVIHFFYIMLLLL